MEGDPEAGVAFGIFDSEFVGRSRGVGNVMVRFDPDVAFVVVLEFNGLSAVVDHDVMERHFKRLGLRFVTKQRKPRLCRHEFMGFFSIPEEEDE